MSFCPHFACFEALTNLTGARTQNRNFGSEKQRTVMGSCFPKGVGGFLGEALDSNLIGVAGFHRWRDARPASIFGRASRDSFDARESAR